MIARSISVQFFLLINFLIRVCLATNYYFDSAPSSGGNGLHSTPFNNLSAISSLSIAPGDNILLKRGSRFSDSLILNQSGSANLPITVQAYGDPRQANPIIDAGDNVFQLNAVLLNGTSYVTVQDLDITNPGDNKTPRRGVYVYAENSGEVRDITLQNLFIHDVRGWMPSTTDTGIGTGKYANASGAIVFEANGNNTASYFADITVQDNVIRSVDRQGIYTWSNWCRRPAMASFWDTLCFQPWYASTGLLVQRNRLYDIGGDGIVVTGNENALVRNNTVIGFNKRSQSPNAGIWTANSDGSLFQYNVVSGGNTIQDGMAYDVDHSTSGTIFEYNVSHDNEGGFFLICPYDKPTQNFTIRYNLSVNDRTRIVEICDGQLVNGKIYKNTIFIGDGISPFIVTEDTDASLDVLLTDNIIYKTGSGHGQWQLNDTVFSVNHNLFFGPIDAYDEATFNTTSAPGLAAAGLRDPKAYLLLSGSAAFDSAVAVAGDAHKDFFSDPTAAYKNLGFYAGPATERPIWVDDFNQNSSLAPGWSSSGQVAIIADPAGDLGQSVQMSPTSTFSHALDVKSSFRLNARIWVASSNIHDGVSPSICLQGVSSAIVLSNFPGLLPGQWQIIEVYVSKEGARLDATVSLDGEPFPISSRKNKLSCAGVNFNSGGTTLYVDDVLLTPL